MAGSSDPLPIIVRGLETTEIFDGTQPGVEGVSGEIGDGSATACRIVCANALWRVRFVQQFAAGNAQVVGICNLPAGTHLVIPSFLGQSGSSPCNRLMVVFQWYGHRTSSYIYDLPPAASGAADDRGSLVIDVVRAE